MSKLLGKSKNSQNDENISQFCSVTGATTKVAKKFLETHKRLDVAIDAYYNDPQASSGSGQSKQGASLTKLNALFDNYKAPDGEDIAVDGTIKLCEDLGVNPEDVVLLAVAYELKSPEVGHWSKQGWVDGWKALHVDTIDGMKSALTRLSTKLGSESKYFRDVYNYTFTFALSQGQRSLGVETAIAFWGLLLPHGLAGGALEHTISEDEDDAMNGGQSEQGWKPEYTDWWFEFLTESKLKGISKDTWVMFLDFVRYTDAGFKSYNADEGAWPSAIDDFVEFARLKLKE